MTKTQELLDRWGLSLPAGLAKRIGNKAFSADGIGMSRAKVILYEDTVLKIEPSCAQNAETVSVMRWLMGKLPVPEVLEFAEEGGLQYLLMSRVPGRMSCDAYYLERPGVLLEGLAEAVSLLWQTDTAGCPRARTVEQELAEARYLVEHRLFDPDSVEPETFGPGGFRDPEALLLWLEENRPAAEPVLSHGDLCLPNLFLDRGRVSGFIDLGDMGVGDKWRDLALLDRSLRSNATGAYGGPRYPWYREGLLYEALGIREDPDKRRWYLLLDELF